MRVEGFAADGYERVRQVFQEMVDDGSRETGAGVSVVREGREVVRLSAGWADAQRRRPWRDNTLVMPYSLSKTFVTLAALVAVRDGGKIAKGGIGGSAARRPGGRSGTTTPAPT